MMFDRFQSKGLDVGTLASNPSLAVFLDPTSLFGRHSAILGQTGSGKSWTVASLVQKTVKSMAEGPYHYSRICTGEYCWEGRMGLDTTRSLIRSSAT